MTGRKRWTVRRTEDVEEYIQSHGYAWAKWNAGTQPFELAWDVQLDEALE